MTKLKALGVRTTDEYKEALDAHLRDINFAGSRADYIISAINQKWIEDSDKTDIPAAKAPHGVRADHRPRGWKSRRYADKYELFIDRDGKVCHFHEVNDEELLYPRYRRTFAGDINGEYTFAYVFIHEINGWVHPELFEDTPLGQKVAAFITRESDDK